MIKKKINKNKAGLALVMLILMFVFLITSLQVSSAQEVSWCCEKTTGTNPSWCDDAPENLCDTGIDSKTELPFKKTQTSCDETGYCKKGCCYDSKEGICAKGTAQRVCDDKEGTWYDDKTCDSVPACSLGCCIVGEQAGLVTRVRCKSYGNEYTQPIFISNINTEKECTEKAQTQDKGACVFEVDYRKTCKVTTRGNCKVNNMRQGANGSITSESASFHKDFLCTKESLTTDCAPTEATTCVDGKQAVYFVDTCGNPANVYDASKRNDQSYWDFIIPEDESCNADEANENSATCGNCDYSLGSYCKEYRKGVDPANAEPEYGNYICRDLDCKDYRHGESWCEYDGDVGEGKDRPGSRHWRYVCMVGEEILEPCEDYRHAYCAQEEIVSEDRSYTTQQALCIPNFWQNCIAQPDKEKCEDRQKGDCMWIAGRNYRNSSMSGMCVPYVPPGLATWDETREQENNLICSQASAQCKVKFKKSAFTGGFLKFKWKCVENCYCLEPAWREQQNEKCKAMADCGGQANYIGIYPEEKGYKYEVISPKLILSLIIPNYILSIVEDILFPEIIVDDIDALELTTRDKAYGKDIALDLMKGAK